MDTLLNLTIFLPIAGVLGILLVKNDNLVKWISLLVTTVTFVLSLPLMLNFDSSISDTAQFLYQSGQKIKKPSLYLNAFSNASLFY